ncbi:hypothetical protein TTHERM_001220401 (macronuclear) [Tetrahymena thermophila SB210]|uniref:Uncharacterized protein n=1 Tax=Tetrahymena thermophila (strain SB210) TaxID=312017 RepID=W7XFF2_TETTS|nr:hypothetical protein TTHERM_001220401 [Tetrahymena thermophila SB210]EWS71519.1 hypothetical protein TTHERM_001220401 [Tetrahymena thermophila SB210]|eukprot:XP_012655947.1 hypothetical protein TTHERM_001220401 [Tetrahymena thermophila SB210]
MNRNLKREQQKFSKSSLKFPTESMVFVFLVYINNHTLIWQDQYPYFQERHKQLSNISICSNLLLSIHMKSLLKYTLNYQNLCKKKEISFKQVSKQVNLVGSIQSKISLKCKVCGKEIFIIFLIFFCSQINQGKQEMSNRN